jgi:hypothetical protein
MTNMTNMTNNQPGLQRVAAPLVTCCNQHMATDQYSRSIILGHDYLGELCAFAAGSCTGASSQPIVPCALCSGQHPPDGSPSPAPLLA